MSISKRFLSLLASASLALALSGCFTSPVTPPVTPPATPPATPTPPVPPVPTPVEPLQPGTFSEVPGWESDDLREAWPAFVASCAVLSTKTEWQQPCLAARNIDAGNPDLVRGFFQTYFIPYRTFNPDGSNMGLVTGYYEPLLKGSRKKGGPYQTPLYSPPDDLLTIDLTGLYPELKNLRLRGRVVGRKVVPYFDRAELGQSGALAGKELVWVDDPIDAFYLQVQGSGRVQLADTGETIRVAYADQNGYPYRSIGRYLVDKGEMTLDQASAQSIKAWFIAHPARRQELLDANPSYVFFREEKIADPSVGPKGALGVPLTPQRSVAVDPQFIPLGAPVFIATTYPGGNKPLQRLVVAQDTGGAIRGPVRADFFWGFGADAGNMAGKMKQQGMLWVLLPKAPASASAKP